MEEGFTVPQRDRLKWVAVDLDGTIARSIWTPDNPTSAIGDPIWENVHKLNGLDDEGFKVVIHTSRAWTDYEAIESWLTTHGIPFRAIVCGKLLAAAYIDDRGRYSEDSSWIPRSTA